MWWKVSCYRQHLRLVQSARPQRLEEKETHGADSIRLHPVFDKALGRGSPCQGFDVGRAWPCLVPLVASMYYKRPENARAAPAWPSAGPGEGTSPRAGLWNPDCISSSLLVRMRCRSKLLHQRPLSGPALEVIVVARHS